MICKVQFSRQNGSTLNVLCIVPVPKCGLPSLYIGLRFIDKAESLVHEDANLGKNCHVYYKLYDARHFSVIKVLLCKHGEQASLLHRSIMRFNPFMSA